MTIYVSQGLTLSTASLCSPPSPACVVPEVYEPAQAGEGGALLQQPGHAPQARVGAGVEPHTLQSGQGILSQDGQPA